MRFSQSSLPTSIAGSMYFVVEKLDCIVKVGTIGSCYLVQQSEMQYNDATRAHVNPHLQIMDSQFGSFIRFLAHEGLEQLQIKPVNRGTGQNVLRKGCYAILSRNEDYFLNDLIVVNNVMDKPDLEEIAAHIPFNNLVYRMFIEDYECLMLSGGKRGNLRYDAGYTAMNQTNSSVIPGMNLPHCLFQRRR